MGSPVGDVVEMEGSEAAGTVARGFAKVEVQLTAACQSRLPGSGPRTVGLWLQDSNTSVYPLQPAKTCCRVAAHAV
jgi:hypothetical protein